LQAEKIYEIRRYQLKPEHLMDYLALTGSDAFDARREASKVRRSARLCLLRTVVPVAPVVPVVRRGLPFAAS
jgi:hypothetical protein